MILNPYRFGRVLVDLPFSGANNTTVITDMTGRSWTAFGTAKISTLSSVLGGSSLSVDGSGDYVQTAHSSDLSVADTSNISISCYVLTTSISSSRRAVAGKRSEASPPNEWVLQMQTTNVIDFIYYNGNTAISVPVSSRTVPIVANTWYFLEVTRVNGVWNGRCNGVLGGTLVQTTAPTANTFPMTIGRSLSSGGDHFDWLGYIDHFKFTKS